MNAASAPLVAHVIHRLDYGGLENGLVNLINNMPEERYRHAIVCMAGFSEFRTRIRRTDVEVHSIDKRPGKDPSAYWRLLRLLRRLRPAITHSRNFGTVDTQWVAAAAGVPRRVHGEHGWDASDPRGSNPRYRRVRKACRPVIHRFVAMSRDLAGWIHSDLHVRSSRIRQIYNGVDTQRFSPNGPVPADLPWNGSGPERPLVIGTVARLDPVKNQRALIEAFGLLVRTTQRPVRLLIVGDGPLRGELETAGRAAGSAGQVCFTGSREDTPSLLRAMDVFVLPSLSEGISNSILEAMASGRAVVAGRVGGNPELITTDCGILCEPSATALAEAISSYLANDSLRLAHGAAGRLRAERDFSLPSMVGGYLNLYDELTRS